MRVLTRTSANCGSAPPADRPGTKCKFRLATLPELAASAELSSRRAGQLCLAPILQCDVLKNWCSRREEHKACDDCTVLFATETGALGQIALKCSRRELTQLAVRWAPASCGFGRAALSPGQAALPLESLRSHHCTIGDGAPVGRSTKLVTIARCFLRLRREHLGK